MPHEPGHLSDEELASILGGAGEEGEASGSSIGRPLFDPNTGEFLGVLTRGRAGERRLFLLRPGSDPIPFQGGTFMTSLGSHIEIDAEGVQRQSRVMPQGATGGGGGLSFEQRRQLDEEERGFLVAEAERERQFKLKRDAAAEATSLIQQQTGLREQARNLVTELFGRDPFRGALSAQGALSVGSPTPVRAFEEQLRGVAAQPIPEPLGAEATLPQLEEQAAGLRQGVRGGLPRPGPLGFARGTEGAGHGMLVGEAGPEVVEFTPEGTVRVIPLTRKAQGGLDEFDPFEQFDTAPAIGRALQPAFEAIGFGGQIPLGQTGAQGQAIGGAFGSFGGEGLTFQPGQAAETFGMLGVRPSLLQAAGTDDFFFRSPEGELRKIGGLADAQAAGFNLEEATVLPFSEIQEMGQFAGQTQTGLPTAELRPFAQRATPLRMPLSVDAQGLPDRSGPSILLPSPRQFAGEWRNLGPDLQGLLLSGWRLSGLSPEQAARELNFFTPRGTASQFATAALR
jgi:hypothetical protein